MICGKQFLRSNSPSIIDSHLQIRDILEKITLDDLMIRGALRMPLEATLTLLLRCEYSKELVSFLSRSNDDSKYTFKNLVWKTLFSSPTEGRGWEGTWLEMPSL